MASNPDTHFDFAAAFGEMPPDTVRLDGVDIRPRREAFEHVSVDDTVNELSPSPEFTVAAIANKSFLFPQLETEESYLGLMEDEKIYPKKQALGKYLSDKSRERVFQQITDAGAEEILGDDLDRLRAHYEQQAEIKEARDRAARHDERVVCELIGEIADLTSAGSTEAKQFRTLALYPDTLFAIAESTWKQRIVPRAQLHRYI